MSCLTDTSKYIFCMSLEFFQSLSTHSESLIAKKLKKIKDRHSVLVLTSNPFTKSSIILCFPCTIKGNQSGVWFQKLHTRSLLGQIHLIWFHFGLGCRKSVGSSFSNNKIIVYKILPFLKHIKTTMQSSSLKHKEIQQLVRRDGFQTLDHLWQTSSTTQTSR